jgi:hypothetical protein
MITNIATYHNYDACSVEHQELYGMLFGSLVAKLVHLVHIF